MNNLHEIINDPELYAELEKAYAIAMPYRPRTLYRLQLLESCEWFDSMILHPSGVAVICAYTDKPFVHPMLLV